MIQLIGTAQRPLCPVLVYSQDENDNAPHNLFIFQISPDGQKINVYDMGDRIIDNIKNAEPVRFVCSFEALQLKMVVSSIVLDGNKKPSRINVW